MAHFVISCGGTGGHLAPGISLAQGLETKGHTCKLIISRRDVDSRLIRKYSQLDYVRAPGVAFSWNPFKMVLFVVREFHALGFALYLLRREKPDALIGFGGYLTVAFALVAFVLGIPIVLHEANRKPGRAIRSISALARRIYLPSGVRLNRVRRDVRRECGFPVRKEIHRVPADYARRALGLPLAGKVLVVLGGSQGASALNQWVTDHFDRLGKEGISVYCITGLRKGGSGSVEMTSRDNRQKVQAIFVDFCDDMSTVLSAADLVVGRAGAGTIAELVRCQIPAVLVPFPHAADNHQLANARYIEQQGAGIVVEQREMEKLTDEVCELIFNDWLLERFRKNLASINRGDALEFIVSDLEGLVYGGDEAKDKAEHLSANHA